MRQLRLSDFQNLLWGQTAITFGTRVMGVALPLLAALTLNATPVQMGLLATAQTIPWLLVTLFAGVWIDRGSPKRVVVVSNLGRGLLLLSIPIAQALGLLSFTWVFVVSLLYGVLNVFFELAVQTWVPSIVSGEKLVAANSQIESTRQVAGTAGPSLGGLLVQVISAPLTLLLNVALYFLSAFMFNQIQAKEERRLTNRRLVWHEIGEGLSAVWSNPILRPLVFSSAVYNIQMGIITAIFLLFYTRDLDVSPVGIGLIAGITSAGLVLGAILSAQITARLGLGLALILSLLSGALTSFIAPLTFASPLMATVILAIAGFLNAFSIIVFNINAISLRQAITPSHLLGRVNASARFIAFGMGSLAALLGGLLAEVIGLRPAMLVAACIGLVAFSLPFFSPIRVLKTTPSPDAA